MAAVSALESLYVNLHCIPKFSHKHLMTCHLALYDCLNDDDSEIREVAARTYSIFKSQSFIPLAAQQAISSDLLKDHATHRLLLRNVISRMTGSLDLLMTESCTLESPELMFKAALSVDNTLFVEEDQNLYIDEVRDVKFWAQIFEGLCKPSDGEGPRPILKEEAISTFVAWVVDAVNTLNTIDRQDGILGWTSKPAAYSACMRTIVSANALLRYESQHKGSTDLKLFDQEFRTIGRGLEEIASRSAAAGFHELLQAEISRGGSKFDSRPDGLQVLSPVSL